MSGVLSDEPNGLPLVPQVEQYWWHAFGPADDVLVVGPTGYDGPWASTLEDAFSPERQYLGTWEHEPTQAEVDAVSG